MRRGGRTSARVRGSVLFVLAILGCNDVGDSSALPGPSTGSDASGDATLLAEGGTGDDDASEPAGPDGTAPGDASVPSMGGDDGAPPTEGGAIGALDSGSLDAGAVDGSLLDAADASPPSDAAGLDASTDAGAIDAGSPDAEAGGGLVPCTVAGQTGCFPCNGNADGLCTATEALLVAHDIAHGRTDPTDATGCYACLVQSGCLDDTEFNDKQHECGDLSGSFGSAGPAGSLCVTTLQCVLATSCSATDISLCFCGADNPGNACQTAAKPDGACRAQEVAGLGVSDNPTVLKDYTDTTRPAGMANQIFACAEVNTCAACLTP
ncbi:MAG TPA: hypothetical protein VGI39_16045 [Polyangiaceae bacterium]